MGKWETRSFATSFPKDCGKSLIFHNPGFSTKMALWKCGKFIFFEKTWYDELLEVIKIRFYYFSEDEFSKYHSFLKMQTCPHCKQPGFLILHGYLYGYSDTSNSERVKRAHRIFCSNRNNRNGCGKTFSIFNAHFIKHFIFTARILWLFLKNIKTGMNPFKAAENLDIEWSDTTIYRLYHRFKNNQPAIRSLLLRIKDPPDKQKTKDPLIQTILHLESVFAGVYNPIAQFQHHFQHSFL